MPEGIPGKRREIWPKKDGPRCVKHREALGFFASAWNRVISRPALRSLSGLQQFNVETPSRLAIAFLSLAQIQIVGGAKPRGCLATIGLWITP
jgi:hypothetical protein